MATTKKEKLYYVYAGDLENYIDDSYVPLYVDMENFDADYDEGENILEVKIVVVRKGHVAAAFKPESK